MNTTNYRIFVEKLPRFRVEAESLRRELNTNLNLSLGDLRLLNVYDLFGFTEELLEKSRYTVFGEVVTDSVTDACDLEGRKYIAVEYLPGQFDQRAASAVDCVRLIDPTADVRIRSSKLLLFDDRVTDEELAKIRHYYINAVESREKDLSVLNDMEQAEVKPVSVLEGFREMEDDALEGYCAAQGLAMNADDLREVVRYFREEGRDPYETELRILDTYWSDHCRHTTFTTELEGITVEESFVKQEIEDSLALYLRIRRELGREHKSICLMDIATIGARYLRKKGLLDDLEVSEENNACSVYVDVDVDGQTEKWLLQFKNETHNHPTEIEPFGGASTCLGGAIRDPLSGRSYVYQAMRVTGAGNIYQKVSDTLPGKLPQSVISKKAAAGYSSYGNQIGLATTHVREVYHPDYVAKRLEVGAVVGAVKAENVRRERPEAGDRIIMLGGRTGRDGIGGATGSSKEHNAKSLETCGSEVQKGNAPEERKLERLFRRPEVTRLIKKSNDFGAGGVSVAIGELADGLDIYLDRVKTKYSGLNSTELAISESQERMAVVIEAHDMEEFMRYCREENIEAVHVADVTSTGRMRMFKGERKVVDLSREFIDSAGAKHYAEARIGEVEHRDPFAREIEGATLAERFANNLRDDNVLSQRGLIEMFDSTIGRSTVLMPFGGRTQRSETQVSVQKLPTDGYTDTASIMAFGYNPYIATWSPYHGAAYAVIEAAAKVVAAGARYEHMRYSYQEYFERMTHDARSWGKPLSALLGALKMQVELGLPSIGGKDSMSGTFQQINVPPMLMAFGITTVDARTVISTDLKGAGHRIYLVRHTPLESCMPDTEQLKRNFTFVSDAIESGKVLAAWSVGFGGVAEGLAKMAFGNGIGVEATIDEKKLFEYAYGSILVECEGTLEYPHAEQIGATVADAALTINGVRMPLEELYRANTERFATVYPDKGVNTATVMTSAPATGVVAYPGEAVEHPLVYIPVFPGTNCDYDTAKAFRTAGAEVEMSVLCNIAGDDILRSIAEMKQHIRRAHIFVLSGGFSAGDEPDGSAKFIVNVLNNADIREEIHALLDRGGLILGICNGFQALVKSGLLPYGRLGMVTKDSPTLFRNDINRHISQIVSTRVATTSSPWLAGFKPGEIHSIAVSHGEGKFVVSEELARELFANGQVAFQYVDAEGNPTAEAPYNPNGSSYAIEGILSPDGRILGKMGHTERYERNLFKNIAGNKEQSLFLNAVNYFRKK
ncbi:phosphoribosylformylglycinamidine synthase [Alistipes sp.]|uniref:phosphoribosylformylglycinamidine synthase n=1 Tax=Alistipes sp. TaxID=1872444 RepID=UPI0025C1DA0A|nr:phosphoribosylformylglycinamidine synthase [Alistipes sp.]MCI7140931.1 phosphoribosylformylglycinamidine synthase [Alistipes sp.]MDY5395981.1 phosphoribosylformylglycinamidine synthase [Alistipes sp.]